MNSSLIHDKICSLTHKNVSSKKLPEWHKKPNDTTYHIHCSLGPLQIVYVTLNTINTIVDCIFIMGVTYCRSRSTSLPTFVDPVEQGQCGRRKKRWRSTQPCKKNQIFMKSQMLCFQPPTSLGGESGIGRSRFRERERDPRDSIGIGKDSLQNWASSGAPNTGRTSHNNNFSKLMVAANQILDLYETLSWIGEDSGVRHLEAGSPNLSCLRLHSSLRFKKQSYGKRRSRLTPIPHSHSFRPYSSKQTHYLMLIYQFPLK